MEHQEVFWDEINSSTHGQGLLWNHLCSDTWKCLSWLSGTAQMDRDHSAPHSFLAFLLRPRCSQIQVPVQHFAALLSLPRPTPGQWIFSGIFCSGLGGTAPNLMVFFTPVPLQQLQAVNWGATPVNPPLNMTLVVLLYSKRVLSHSKKLLFYHH